MDEKLSDREARSKLGSLMASLRGHTAGVIATALLTALFGLVIVLFYSYLAPPANLAGYWKFTVTYQDTAKESFRGMRVTYVVFIAQEGLELRGEGEKISAFPLDNPEGEIYAGKRRIPIEIEGTISRNYFAHNEVNVLIKEEGDRRRSSTSQDLRYFRPRTMCGCFQSTIADTSGPVWWEEFEIREGFEEPVERPAVCADVSCPEAN